MTPKSARRAARVVEIKAEIGYVEPRFQEVCARCRHFRQRGPRGVQAWCTSSHIDVAGKGRCDQFDWPDGKGPPKPRGTWGTGEGNPRAVLTESDIPRIFTMRRDGWTQDQIAETLKVTRQNISQVLCGRTWRHVPRPPPPESAPP